jgi:hypothetical protein
MDIAYVTLSGRGLIDDCLAEAVADLEARGFRLAGTVRVLPADPHAHACDMDVRVLPDGPSRRISQPLGTLSQGCRLDTDAVETLALAVESRISGADLLVVNKFGKQEAAGRGLRQAIVMAIEADIPVLIGVNGLNLPEFLAFVGNQAVRIEATPEDIVRWASSERLARAEARQAAE